MGDILSSDIQSEKICDILIELKPRGHIGLWLLSYPLLTHALSCLVWTTWYEAKTFFGWFRLKVDETKTTMYLKV